MKQYESLSITAIALLLVGLQSKTILADETDICTCYSFHTIKNTWDESNHYCQQYGGNLVSMETEEEYQFINKTIQSLDKRDNEWYIGLTGINDPPAGKWMWDSGHRMKTKKWSKGEPSGIQGEPWYKKVCVKMAKYYKGLGLFDDINCRLRYMFICENKTGQKCPSSSAPKTKFFERCTSQKKITTTTKGHTRTTPFLPSTSVETTTTPRHASTTAIQKNHSYSIPPTDQKLTIIMSSSTENGRQTRPFFQTTIPEVLVSSTTKNGATRPTQKIAGDAHEPPKSKSSGSDSFPLVIVTVALGAVLAVSVCLLLFACYWKRREKRDKNEKPRLETASLSPDATGHSSNNNQGPEDGGFQEGVQLFNHNGGEPYVAYAVIHNNLAQQNQGPNASSEPAYASIQDENMIRRSSKKNDRDAAIPAATVNAENSGNSIGGGKSNTEVVYASVDKSKKNNKKNESQNGNQWPSGQQVVYASVDKSKKSKPRAEDAVYAEVGSKDNTEKQQSYQITYAELADFNENRAPEQAVKPAPYQPAEYAVIIGQKQKT